jgi:hypothetical protein
LTAQDPDPGTLEPDEKDPKWYRDTISRQTATIAELKGRLERESFHKLGLTPDEGMGKAIKLTFEGDATDPDNLDVLKAHAKDQFGYEYQAPKTADTPLAPVPPTTKPLVSDGEGRIGQLDKASVPAEPDALQDQGEQAVADGDITKALRAFVEKQLQDGTINLGGPER